MREFKMVALKDDSLNDKRRLSSLEDELAFQLNALKIPFVREYKFSDKRKWKSDFYFPESKLIVEVEGGVESHGKNGRKSRHCTPSGFMEDCVKYNEASILGHTVMRVTGTHIKKGIALEWIERYLCENAH